MGIHQENFWIWIPTIPFTQKLTDYYLSQDVRTHNNQFDFGVIGIEEFDIKMYPQLVE